MQKKRIPSKTIERSLAILALLTFLIAWIIGYRIENGEVEPYLSETLPEAASFVQLDANTYAAYADEQSSDLIGYIGIGEVNGYGGPMKTTVAVDLDGVVTGMAIVKNRETPTWFERVIDSGYVEKMFGKSYTDSFQLGVDVDGVTSATYTSRAIAQSALQTSQSIASNQLGFTVPTPPPTPITFGIPEITLIVLYAVGFFGHKGHFKYKKQLRWAGMIAGMVVLGFMYNAPLTLSYINKLLLGFWPNWRTNLYWYLLIGGILLVFTVDNKNPYCQWFCPFGAAQECMGAIGGAKVYSPGKYRNFLMWLRRGVVWFAIAAALLFRSPGLTSYEIFGSLFSLVGSYLQFALLAMVLVASLFIRRPWCTYLCPLAPIEGFIRMSRRWIFEQWKKIRIKRIEKLTN